jgi:hypothetical protein
MRPPRERINRCCRHAPLVTAAGQASAKGRAATHGTGDASKESTRILLYVTDASNRYTVERNGGTSNTAPTQASCGRSSPQSVAPCRQWAGTALLRNRRRRRPFVRGRIRSCCARKTTGRNGGGGGQNNVGQAGHVAHWTAGCRQVASMRRSRALARAPRRAQAPRESPGSSLHRVAPWALDVHEERVGALHQPPELVLLLLRRGVRVQEISLEGRHRGLASSTRGDSRRRGLGGNGARARATLAHARHRPCAGLTFGASAAGERSYRIL